MYFFQSNFEDIEQINTESEDFASLPAEIKHELLTEMKDHRHRTRWAKAGEMPEVCDCNITAVIQKLF